MSRAAMIEVSVTRLQVLCNTIPSLLSAIDEGTMCEKLSLTKWSKKEIIGHLIDSATNNHHRFIRGQFEDTPRIIYDQNAWNTHSYYNEISSSHLIAFWELYNRHLIALVRSMPREKLNRLVQTGEQESHSIAFLLNDYVEHLEHHLRQIIQF